MSPKLSKEVQSMMKKLDSQSFLEWLQSLNYIPLINPQTFQLDDRKRISKALKSLETFDYVIPYEDYSLFLKELAPTITIQQEPIKHLPISISKVEDITLVNHFIQKDIELYQKSKLLWERIQKNQYKPLRYLIKQKQYTSNEGPYLGAVRKIDSTSVEGWVFKQGDSKSLEIMLYRNDILLHTCTADHSRIGMQKIYKHATHKFGFHIKLDKPSFTTGDSVEVKISGTEIFISLENSAIRFLET